jgi:hypothetical protein
VGELCPDAFTATTVNVYVMPAVSPLTTHGLAVQVAVSPPGEAVTTYPVTFAPPSALGAIHDTEAAPLP